MFIVCHCLVLYCEVEIVLEIVIKLANSSGGTTQWLLHVLVCCIYGVGAIISKIVSVGHFECMITIAHNTFYNSHRVFLRFKYELRNKY